MFDSTPPRPRAIVIHGTAPDELALICERCGTTGTVHGTVALYDLIDRCIEHDCIPPEGAAAR